MIKFVNSLTGRKEVLKTAVPGVLNWYACGPTVYDDAHLGHARTYITQDIIRRIIERYGNFRVNLQLGITDIDDKIINKAALESSSYKDISKKYEFSFIKAMRGLNVKSPWKYSRKRGFVYPKFNCSTNDTVLEDSEKRKSADFALWKAAKPGEPSWEAFDGRGRPGWHVECSTMIHKGLGKLDLHSGGIDLRFPHHENEIAQSEAFYGNSQWCTQFIHFGHVKYGGEKMSKSLRNFITIDEFLESHDPSILRMMCLMKPYSEDFEIADSLVSFAKRNLDTIKAFVANCNHWIEQSIECLADEITEANLELKSVLEPMFNEVQMSSMDDFNTSKSLRTILSIIDKVESFKQTNAINPLLLEQVMLFVKDFFSGVGIQLQSQENLKTMGFVDELVSFRAQVRQFALTNAGSDNILKLCDQVRQTLSNQNIAVNDSSDKSLWKFK